MNFTHNWLKQYIDFDWSPEELAEKLTWAGIEVENVVSFGGGALDQQEHPRDFEIRGVADLPI